MYSRRAFFGMSAAAFGVMYSRRSWGAVDVDEFDVFASELMVKRKVEGLCIGAVEDGAVAWVRSYGSRHTGDALPFERDTVIEAASLTKPVVAYCALGLAESGALDLDAPLSAYVDVGALSKDERIEDVTPRLCLCHRSGLANRTNVGEGFPFVRDVDEVFSYSGAGYVCVQRVMEAITGELLAEHVQKQLLEPLGMQDSSLVWREDYEGRVAHGHHFRRGPMAKSKPGEGNAAWSLHTTAGDYAKFVALMMARGNGEAYALKDATVEAMLSRVTPVDEGVHWGLGWGLQSAEGGDQFWHWGNNGNVFHHFVTGSRATVRGIVILTNGQNGRRLFRELPGRYMGTEQPGVSWLN